VLIAVTGSGFGAEGTKDLPSSRAALLAPEDAGLSRAPARFFISGHSLTDNPLPDYLAQVSHSLGTRAEWNQQNIPGSSIRRRTRGAGAGEFGWRGYSEGKNRDGEGLNVIDELLRPQTVSGAYDVLIVTEQHGLLGSMIWDDTIGYLRHFHDRVIDGNPQAATYLYEPWLGVSDRSDPSRWIEYERQAAPVWQCIVTRVNVSLAAEGRADRIRTLPAASALAALVERATQGAGVSGVSGRSAEETMARLFKDDVHLTSLGTYYIALVTYAVVHGRSPVGGWAPSGVTAGQADNLQRLAEEFAAEYSARNQPMTLEACQAFVRDSFVRTYWTYVRDTYWRKDIGPLRAYVRWIRHMVQWRYRFGREDGDSPLRYDPSVDAKRWYSAPEAPYGSSQQE
jgi:hypothetical protein